MKRNQSNNKARNTAQKPESKLPPSKFAPVSPKNNITSGKIQKTDNTDDTEKKSIWNTIIKSFENNPDQYFIIALTLIIVVLGTCQTCKYVDATDADLRAYICYTRMDTCILEASKFKKIEINFTNTGKTPAYDLRSESHIAVCDSGTELSQKGVDTICVPKKGGRVVGAGQTTLVIVTDSMHTKEEFQLVKDGKATVFVYGRIFYNDRLGKFHFTNYCMSYRFDRKRLLPSQYGNNAD